MRINKYSMRAAILIFLSFLLISCGTSLHTNVRDVQLDMTRQEVVSRMGNDYEVVSMIKTDLGRQETIRYTTYILQDEKAVPHRYYFFHFLDGKLVEMNQEEAMPPLIIHPRH